jgi:F-type H+-transporting ATPase subunit gamma
MARSLRDLRRKMRAIKSTRQVTKAMELVAASKMRKAVQNAQLLRHYALMAWQLLQHVAHVQREGHPFLTIRPVRRVLVVVFTSDRGLCGSLNTQVLRQAQRYLQTLRSIPSFEHVEFLAVGRKGQQALVRAKNSVVAAFPAFSNNPIFRDVLPIARMVTEKFIDGTYDHVVLLYPDFVSALVQEPTVKVLLPFSATELRSMIDGLATERILKRDEALLGENKSVADQYQFEPSDEAVFNTMLPKLTEVQLYQAALETAASEHSARMVAMRNASDSASDLLDDLGLVYNQTRQANITAELAELSASKAALDS